jgi:L,D-transpeptidase YcbB
MTTKTADLLRAGIVPAAAALLLACQVSASAEESPPAKADATQAAAVSPTEVAKDAAASKSIGDSLNDATPRPAPSLEKMAGHGVDKSAMTSSITAAKPPPVATAAASEPAREPKPTDAQAAPAAAAAAPYVPEPSQAAESTAKADDDAKPDDDAATKAAAAPADKDSNKDADETPAATADKPDDADETKAATAAPEDKDADETKAATAAKPDDADDETKAAAAPADATTGDNASAEADVAAVAKDDEAKPDASATGAAKPADEATKAAALPAASVESPSVSGTGQAAAPATTGPRDTAALPDPAAHAPDTGVADQVLPPADSVIANVRHLLQSGVRGASKDDVDALTAYYGSRSGPAIWVSTDGLTAKGKAVAAEIGKADDWGLRSSDFRVPRLQSGAITAEAAAQAEVELAAAVLKYARYARGGRVNPSSISKLMDQSPTLRAPSAVLTEIASSSTPDAYLRSLHPQHEQFQLLRKALLKLRGGDVKEEEPEEDPALSVKLPPGGVIRPGAQDSQVALLRRRLKVPADDPADDEVYDARLRDAVLEFQRANRLRPDGIIGNNTRSVLNGAPRPVMASADSKIERILINMERWRWMPEELGEFYVWDNVPEFLTRVIKNDKVIHTDKIIVGQPSWPTPVFSADMKHLVFNPSWGVPNGIKRKELAPLLRKSSGGGGLFGIFGGGYSSQAVLDAYHLKVYYNGRQIDPNQVDWNSVNIATYSFTQPPGPKNPLGYVKFMFPNKHDVYMHDTPERHLFVKSFRALSHGCMRVEEPRKFAEVILAEDKGWSPQRVSSMYSGSNTVQLNKHIPVHVTYFTARVDENGRLRTYNDFYGLDSRTASALTGRRMQFDQQRSPDYDDGVASPAPPSASNRPSSYKKQTYSGPATLADAISDMFSP